MDIMTDIAILVLAAFVGFEVISKVPNTLHTPLMSGTNAIHGIVLLGGLLVLWWSLPARKRVVGLVVSVPRFSNAAFVSVLALIGSGIGAAVIHLPTFSSLCILGSEVCTVTSSSTSVPTC